MLILSCPHICVVTEKDFSTQYALLSLQRVLMDLSKVFDTLNHEPLISKLDAYEVGKESLMLL